VPGRICATNPNTDFGRPCTFTVRDSATHLRAIYVFCLTQFSKRETLVLKEFPARVGNNMELPSPVEPGPEVRVQGAQVMTRYKEES